MPHAIQGSLNEAGRVEVKEDLNYSYPEGLELRPDSEAHAKLLQRVLRRVEVSHDHMKKRHPSWRSVDQTLTAYIPIDEAEAIVKSRDARKPVSMVFPHSYSILETLTSSLGTLFLSDVIFRYSGASPEDTMGAVLLEKIVDLHCKRFKADLVLHTSFKDSFAYGLGATFLTWESKLGYRTLNQTNPDGSIFKQSEPTLLFEGSRLHNIDPYLLLLDPNYGVQKVQDSEFVGFISRTNYNNLLRTDRRNGVFNIGYLKGLNGRSRFFEAKREGLGQKEAEDLVLSPMDVVYLYINIVPKEWDLGDYEQPEKWLFAVAADRVIIQAQPLNLDHDMFPVALCAPTFDGYSSTPLSRLELLGGMQELTNYLFNSHITNLRKAVNDMIIYDPYMINTDDLEEPKPGKLVRMRRAAWGKDVRGSLMQLEINDLTRNNVSDAQLIMSIMNQVSGADDAVMGSLRQSGPDRLSAAEFTATNSHAMGRLESLARIVGSQYLHDLGYMLAMHTQQFISAPVYIQTVGEWQQQLQTMYGNTIHNNRMKVTPSDLNIDYDIVVNGQDIRGQAQAGMWLQLYQTILQNPWIAPEYDLGRIFRYIAVSLGAKNVDNFLRVQPVLAPTGDVMAGVQAGNMMPVEELANALAQ